MRSRILLPVFLFACSSPELGPDAGDASHDAPILGEKDGANDSTTTSDVVTADAPIDVAEEAAVDAGADVVDAATDVVIILDAGADVSLGGDFCPILGTKTCVNGFEFRTHIDGGSTDYNCGAVTPHCPTGWVCWALNSQNQPVYGTCP